MGVAGPLTLAPRRTGDERRAARISPVVWTFGEPLQPLASRQQSGSLGLELSARSWQFTVSPTTGVRYVARSSEISPGEVSGGTNTSHTIGVQALAALLAAVPPGAPHIEYRQAALEGNVLSKATEGARRRTFRYLKELYLLRPDSILFRALRDLWQDDLSAQPLLAGLCALARDSVFRASSAAIFSCSLGEAVTSGDLAAVVGDRFPGSYSDSTLAKIGRNTFSSWEQTGHLVAGEPARKVRVRAVCRPANVAYALLLGHLQGVSGQALFETLWAQVLDQPKSHLVDMAFGASQRGLLEFRHAGGVVDVTFRELLRPFEGELL